MDSSVKPAFSLNSRSRYLRSHGLRIHLREWGDEGKPKLLILHGWLDVSATFQPLAEILAAHFHVIAPDARGFGHSQWQQGGYWFPDYVADVSNIADHLSPDSAVIVVGHSMGAQIGSLYAGIKPDRVAKYVCLDGLFLPDMESKLAPKRFRKWLEELASPPQQKTYESYHDLASRIQRQHSQLSDAHALFIAQCWGNTDGNGIIRLCADPMHRLHGPMLYHAEDSKAVWREITAPTLFVDAEKSDFAKAISKQETAERRSCFRTHQQIMLDGVGHMVHFDAPQKTAESILPFLLAG